MSKLIIPAEVKICATCSYWDGKRKIDPERGVVVLDEATQGECLVKDDKLLHGMNDEFRHDPTCLWEHLVPDEIEISAAAQA